MKLRPTNATDFLTWFVDQLCKHPAEHCILNGDAMVCKRCCARIEVAEATFERYASRYVKWVRDEETSVREG